MKKLIKTEGTKYAQNLAPYAIIDTKQIDGKPILIDAGVLEEALTNADSSVLSEFTEAANISGEDTFELNIGYSDNQNLFIQNNVGLEFNEDMWELDELNGGYTPKSNLNISMTIEDITVPPTAILIDITSWEILTLPELLPEELIAVIENNSGFPGLNCTCNIPKGAFTKNDKISAALELDFTFGENIDGDDTPLIQDSNDNQAK